VNTPTNTPTLTVTPDSSATATPSETPTITPTPLPTDTPQPPRFHTVQSGETIISIALLYGITVDSIIETNGVNPTTIQGGQDLQIPWPTATPPLQPLAVEVGEDVIIVDPSVCPPFYEIKEGDNIFGIAAQNRVPFDAMLSLNRLTIDSVIRPGDVICIPAVIENGVLPPTPGPSPTPSSTPAPAGPQLLYPAPGSVVENPDSVVALQWLAVKDLTAEEYYMIEVTDLTDPTAHPRRGFTRSNSFQLPSSWRAPENAVHEFRWRVSIVHVTDFRADGSPIYTYGGRTSADATFFWLGAVPTATPTATPTLTPTATHTPEPTE
ncbi:MAG: LysM peptidoglycan-binding domain-containing protein, partial [Anaerolineales bacterium]|nr:LysM peptidoglycan-binding domain-containing protein [Anaerolineales bacterium]